MVPACSMTKRKVISGEEGSMPISFSATITCAELETGSSSAMPCTMARIMTCKRAILHTPVLRARADPRARTLISPNSFTRNSEARQLHYSREELHHRKGVATTRIIALPNAASTIAVLAPEGNGCGVVCCGLERDMADAIGGEAFFGFNEQARSRADAPITRQNIDCHDIAPRVAMRGQDETDGLASNLCNGAVGVGKPHVIAEFAARVGDRGFIADLIDSVERFEVRGSVRTKENLHTRQSSAASERERKGRLLGTVRRRAGLGITALTLRGLQGGSGDAWRCAC